MRLRDSVGLSPDFFHIGPLLEISLLLVIGD